MGTAASGEWTRYDEIIDVRTPDEYETDHVPKAINLPVLGNMQRAEIGTLYRNSSFAARRKGASLVAHNIAEHLERELSGRPSGWRPLVYCWRGGQRSRSFVQVMREIGWDADQLAGGYKAYRRWVMENLEALPARLRLFVLAGRTGVGKSHVLRRLRERGAPALDLEGLASHRGSVFGVAGKQPSQRSFESALCAALLAVEKEPFAFVESESRRIGGVHVPGALLARMREAPVIALEAEHGQRARHIVSEYRSYVESLSQFRETLGQIMRYTGKERAAEWLELHSQGKYGELVGRMLAEFYDVGYDRSLRRNYGRSEPVAAISVDPCDPASIDLAARGALAAAAAADP